MARASAASIFNFFHPTIFFESPFFSAYKQKKQSKTDQLKVKSSAATGEIWLMSQRTLIPRCFFFFI